MAKLLHMATQLPSVLILGLPSVYRDDCATVLATSGFHVEISEALPEAYPPEHPEESQVCIVLLTNPENASRKIKAVRILRPRSPLLALNATLRREMTATLLDSGADDVIFPSQLSGELAARLRALHRRYSLSNTFSGTPLLEAGDLRIDFRTDKVWVRGREVLLSPTEFRILRKLSMHIGKVVPHQDLLSAVWGDGKKGGANALRVYIRHIRQKARAAGEAIEIVARPGIGYMLAVAG